MAHDQFTTIGDHHPHALRCRLLWMQGPRRHFRSLHGDWSHIRKNDRYHGQGLEYVGALQTVLQKNPR